MYLVSSLGCSFFRVRVPGGTGTYRTVLVLLYCTGMQLLARRNIRVLARTRMKDIHPRQPIIMDYARQNGRGHFWGMYGLWIGDTTSHEVYRQ
jgi:hypothetical protein